MSSGAMRRMLRSLIGSIILAIVLIVCHVAVWGGFLLSGFLCLICLVWFLLAIARALIWRKGWRLAIARILIPVVTLALVIGIPSPPEGIPDDVELIIQACERYRAKNGMYPRTLDVLVPEYLKSEDLKSLSPDFQYSVHGDFYPRKVYCFYYPEFREEHTLMYTDIPPFHTRYYDFESASWGGFD